MINASQTVIGDTFELPPSAISPTSEGIQTFLRANAASLTPLQLDTLREAMDNARDNYALDLIKVFGWDGTDIGVDADTFCTYFPSCQTEFSVTARFNSNFNVTEALVVKTSVEEPRKSQCHVVESAGFAASHLSVQNLELWTADEIYECLEVLARVKWSDKAAFWKFVTERAGSRSLH